MAELGGPLRLRSLPDHFSVIEDPREAHRVAFPRAELLLLAVCDAIVIAAMTMPFRPGAKGTSTFCAGLLPFDHGVPGRRWLTIMIDLA